MDKTYYKVIKNNKVIDVLDQLIFIKHQKKHNIPVTCSENEAEAFLSSDGCTIWHEETWYQSKGNYDTVKLVPIDIYEYKQLKMLNCKTPEEIIEEYTLSLIEGGIL